MRMLAVLMRACMCYMEIKFVAVNPTVQSWNCQNHIRRLLTRLQATCLKVVHV